ncbi:MAG: hypothetical protein HC904_10845 [Blastochloris sp.]|nr:hypothetical protein [Blastochloris sp.]
MNEETPQDHLERKLVHAAANEGLNQRIDLEIAPKAWSFLKYINCIMYFLLCLPPGLYIAYLGFCVTFYSGHRILGISNPLTGVFIVFVGLAWTALGIYLMRHTLKKP